MNTELKEQKQTDTQKHTSVLLFVCTGNTCRSPMAAALYNAEYAGRDDSHAVSAGLNADGSPISRNAAMALADCGIVSANDNSYLWHNSHTVTEEDMQAADMVIGMTGRHAMQLMFLYPAYAGKITALPVDIADPYGKDLSVYKICLEQIRCALAVMFDGKDVQNEA